jgi:dTDP-4-dehydrorhamnose 3,5-epimerase-like enzyme
MIQLNSDIYNCNVIELPRIHNRAGNITIFQNESRQPFNVRRVYYLYDVPGGAERGGHAHRNIYQLIVAAGGSFDVILDDGKNRKIVPLNRPYFGLLVVPGIWRELVNFSSGAVCLVLASEKYTPEDYIREYSDFMNYRKELNAGRS